MSNQRKLIHEIYHQKTNLQIKLIDENNFTYKLLLPEIKKYLAKNKKVLDIGCGAGTLDFFIAKYCKTVTGIDISEKAINSCRESAKILNINNVIFKNLDFPNETLSEKFDVIIFTEVIEHIKDDKKALKEVWKMLNNKGVLILSTPSKNAPLYKMGLLNDFDKEVGHLRRYDEKELKSMIEKSGFKILKSKKIEGIIRNFLFTNSIAGKSVRFIKYFISDIVTAIDNITLVTFGESNYIIIAKKI